MFRFLEEIHTTYYEHTTYDKQHEPRITRLFWSICPQVTVLAQPICHPSAKWRMWLKSSTGSDVPLERCSRSNPRIPDSRISWEWKTTPCVGISIGCRVCNGNGWGQYGAWAGGAYIRIEPPPHISFGFISNTPADTPYKEAQKCLQFLFWLKPWYKSYSRAELIKMRSQLVAQFMPFFLS